MTRDEIVQEVMGDWDRSNKLANLRNFETALRSALDLALYLDHIVVPVALLRNARDVIEDYVKDDECCYFAECGSWEIAVDGGCRCCVGRDVLRQLDKALVVRKEGFRPTQGENR
uniref:Uncharacterized protein n=1 Tax=viral metagenome TaxID=1070528 RepID=A0A6H1ZE07_9ZZZZ